MEKTASTVPQESSPLADQDRDEPGMVRFTYPSGSQPLSGYTIKRGIGVGGFGEVYYALSDAGKEVALKRVQRNLDIELRGVRHCLNLKHPHLLALYDIRFDSTGQAWVVMEYVIGESLTAVVDRHPDGMPLDEVQRWFQGIAAGVQYLHDHGIVHRDLKPGNIFLDDGVVKIGDYGLSKFISCSRRSGQTGSVGTFHYMAPEIGQGKYGREIDIYALGILLYEMLTGRVPFDGESSQEIIMKHLTAQPEMQGMDRRYAEVVQRALAKAPEDRFASVAEMAQALGLAAQPSSAQLLPAVRPIPVPAVASAPAASPRARRAAASSSDAQGDDVSRDWLSEPVRWVLLMALVILIMTRIQWLVPIAATVGTVYAFYLLFSVVLDLTFGPQDAGSPGPAAITPAQHEKALGRQQRHADLQAQQAREESVRSSLARAPALERAAQLVGSMLMSAVVCAILGLIMTVIGSERNVQIWSDWLPMYAWLAIGSTLGSWAVLIPSKFWEAGEADAALRRFVQLVMGMALGAAVGLLGTFLLVDPTYVLQFEPLTAGRLPALLYTPDGLPRILAYALYFGGLMVALRWWHQADPLRPTRLGLAATLAVTLTSVGLWLFLPIPRSFMMATSMSIAVQLAAPWISPRQRNELIT